MDLDRLRWLSACAAISTAGCATSADAGGDALATPAVQTAPPAPPATGPASARAFASMADPSNATREDVPARFFTNPQEQKDELARHPLFPWLSVGLQAEAEAGYEGQGSERTYDAFFDSITAGLQVQPTPWILGQFELSYDIHDTRDFAIDEAIVRVGATSQVPWFAEAGKTDLPFGEFNSHFREDPLVQLLGEIQDYEFAVGYESDAFETSLTAFRARTGSRKLGLIGNFTISLIEDVMDAGVYGCSDIGEATETRIVQDESVHDDPRATPRPSAVRGAGAFFAIETERYSLDLEYTTALQKFQAGLVGDGRERPSALSLDAAIRPLTRWEVAVRLETARGVPDAPRWQCGIGTSYGVSDQVSVSLEYLHGWFANREPSRDIVTLGLTFVW